MSITLYHLTPSKNVQSIIQSGLRPSNDGLVYFSLKKYDTIFLAPCSSEVLFSHTQKDAPEMVILGIKFEKDKLKKSFIKPLSVTDDNGYTHTVVAIMYPGVVSFVGDMEITPITTNEILERYRKSDYVDNDTKL